MEFQQHASKRLKILSLDGGGVRGLSALVILQVLWQKYEELLRRAGLQDLPAKPYEFFDLIGGTSTGGLIALMLGRLRMGVDECIRAYEKLSEQIFGNPRKRPWSSYKFSSSNFEKVLKEFIEERTRVLSQMETPWVISSGDPDAPLIDPSGSNNTCKTVVFALSALNQHISPAQFRTYKGGHQRYKEATIWQAARATTAAQTFFEPVQLSDDSKWSDAGIGFNNASQELQDEAGRLWGDSHGREFEPNRDLLLFLNIGTGMQSPTALGVRPWKRELTRIGIPLEAIETMCKAALNSEQVTERMGKQIKPDIYYRFNVESGLNDVRLFEYERLGEIEQLTHNYLSKSNMTDRIADCADLILQWHILKSRMPDATVQQERVSISRYAPIYERAKKNEIHGSGIFRFYHLGGTDTNYLKKPRQTGLYWDSLTARGLEEYQYIYDQLPKEGEHYVRILGLLPYVTQKDTPSSLPLPTILSLWKTTASTPHRPGTINDLLPKNLTLTLLFLLHLARTAGFEGNPLPLTIEPNRIKVNACFGNWTRCLCQSGPLRRRCDVEWNFASLKAGLYRGGPAENCIVVKRVQDKIALYEEAPEVYLAARDAHDRTRGAWVGEFEEEAAGVLSFEEARRKGIV